MKQYTKYLYLLIPIVVLQGCGGGGGDDGGGGTTDGGEQMPNDEVPGPLIPVPGNQAPQSYDLSLRTDRSSPILDVQLMGDDPENDTIIYVLDTAREGSGYSLAFVEADTGVLHVVMDDTQVETLSFDYRVSDGSQYSDPSTLSIEIGSIDENGLGANDVSPEEYAAIDIAYFGEDLLGDSDGALPESIDLSNNFPPPGDQGETGSCVGWAVGYALKSYQEKVEENWEYSSTSTLFSPSWIYNQINDGVDLGSRPTDALQLIVDSGAATLATMPYSDGDYRTQPGSEARAEAAYYKADSFAAVRSLDMIKRSLAARTPVTIGIDLYDSFYRLTGTRSVFNDYAGSTIGGHAVTIVGYDDNAFGGAFKVINSWGTDWGDGGYFWLPYNAFSTVVQQAYVLTDAPNSGDTPEPPVQPPVDGSLPNLVVENWSATYNASAGGSGELQWRVTNTGTSTAPAGADVNLILSRDERIDPTDVLVVYEELNADLVAGESLYRDESNALPFSFPLDLPDGDYYMVLWVDDLDEVEESDNTDNISYGSSLVSIAEAQLPDLVVESWWASWSQSSGAGELEYSVANVGNRALSSTGWDINLVLSKGVEVRDTFSYYLFYEDGGFALEPNQTVYRDEDSRAQFNLYESSFGEAVLPGDYYISLWVDDTNVVEESREYNNLSTDNGAISISSRSKSQDATTIAHRFNGKSVPTDTTLLAKVTIETTATGEKKVASFSKVNETGSTEVNGVVHYKQNSARDQVIFPSVGGKPMPAAKSASDVVYKELMGQ